jgi:tRNA threonylcarbamoyladenosine biosynthesis protein TsaE
VKAECILHSESDTERLAGRLASGCVGGLSLGLIGDLGAGKTTLVRALVRALGGGGEQVSSPSYALENEYRLTSDLAIEHWDLYRLRHVPEELLEPPSPSVVRIVEWPNKIPEYQQTLDVVLELEVLESGARKVQLSGRAAERFEQLVEDV